MSEEFDKELPSDVDDATALPLLDEQADTNEQWKDFSESDLPLMLEVFSILKMKAGERLIAAGEYASFCGIILQGTFTAQVTPTLKVELKAGDTIGEVRPTEDERTQGNEISSDLESSSVIALACSRPFPVSHVALSAFLAYFPPRWLCSRAASATPTCSRVTTPPAASWR